MGRDFPQLLRLVDQLGVAVLHVHLARIAGESNRDLPRLFVGVLGRGAFRDELCSGANVLQAWAPFHCGFFLLPHDQLLYALARV